MSDSFETVTEDSIGIKRGRELRVRVQAFGDAETHYGIDLREYITESTASIKGGIVAGNGRVRSTYTGWTRSGFFLAPHQVESLIDALTSALMVALEHEADIEAKGVAA